MIDGLRAFGVGVDDENADRWIVVPPERLRAPENPIDCGLAGTVMRFLPAVALLTGGQVEFVGDEHASARPLEPLLAGLEQLGAQIDAPGGSLPLTLKAPAVPGGPEVTIDASASSQFISALLLIGPRLPKGLTLQHDGGPVPSLPHIEMTCEWLRTRGADVTQTGASTWRVEPQHLRAVDAQIAPDLTNAAAFLAAGVLSGGATTVRAWPTQTTQAGAQIIDVLRAMGASVALTELGCTASSHGCLHGTDVDLRAASELTPVVAGLAALAADTTRISGVGHIRGHETDRLKAISEQLSAVGVDVRQSDDGLIIEGSGGTGLHGATLQTYGDHRMAHLAALLGVVIPGVVLDDVSVASKTMPDFADRWANMIGATL